MELFEMPRNKPLVWLGLVLLILLFCCCCVVVSLAILLPVYNTYTTP